MKQEIHPATRRAGLLSHPAGSATPVSLHNHRNPIHSTSWHRQFRLAPFRRVGTALTGLAERERQTPPKCWVKTAKRSDETADESRREEMPTG